MPKMSGYIQERKGIRDSPPHRRAGDMYISYVFGTVICEGPGLGSKQTTEMAG